MHMEDVSLSFNLRFDMTRHSLASVFALFSGYSYSHWAVARFQGAILKTASFLSFKLSCIFNFFVLYFVLYFSKDFVRAL
jgi:hypothetical protein